MSIAIAVLLGIVAFSYRQVCIAYPNGGGSYSVSKENFGRLASLVAASALLIDYNLTVAVSTSSAVEQIASAVPALAPISVAIGVAAIGLITIGNLRGLREAGNIFAVPTYLFLFSALLMIGIGVYRIVVLGDTRAPSPEAIAVGHQDDGGRRRAHPAAGLRLRGGGADRHGGDRDRRAGVQATRVEECRDDVDGHGRRAGRAVRGDHLPGHELRGRADRGAGEADGHLAGRGHRLRRGSRSASTCSRPSRHSSCSWPRTPPLRPSRVSSPCSPTTASSRASSRSGAIDWPFPRGSSLWVSLAASLVVIFGGETHALIPLYAVGVFIDFTIAQAGMVRHWCRERPPGWRSADRDQRRRLCRHRRRRRRRHHDQVRRRSLPGHPAHPHPRGHDALHPARVQRPGGGTARP
ncbi:MAG: amino acid permease [Candidatus Limnocylindrales bacterium]